MGKRQPKITNKKHRKKNKNQNSSKSSRRLNNYSKRSKSRFNSFFSQNGRNSKRDSSKKWQRNINNYDNNFNSFNNIINITNNNNFSNNNFFIVDPIWNNIQNNNEKPEWMTEETEKIEDSNQRFSKEIMEYVTYVTPKNRSSSERETTVHRLRQIIEKKRPEWKVHLFGSYKQGTSTVFSDLDFEIIIDKNSSRKRDIDELFILMKILRKFEFSENIRLIRARVPILKATCTVTQINVDISVNRHNGYQAADLIKNILSRHKILRPTIIIIKILLKIYGFNEAHTGGMSSFLLFHLVYFYYIIYKKNKINKSKKEDFKTNTIINYVKPKNTFDNNFFCEDNSESNDKEEDEDKSENKITLTKAASYTDDEFNSNDDDSNLVQNGASSSDSDLDHKNDENESNNRLKLPNTYNTSDENNNSEENSNEEIQKNEEQNNIDIGDFILNFLYYYALKFNDQYYGIKVSDDDSCEIYIKANRFDMECSDSISVESIQESNMDVGKSCYNYNKIKRRFLEAYNKIKSGINNNNKSILQILNFPTI